MTCMCSEEDCGFSGYRQAVKEATNLIVTPDEEISSQELMHVMMSGVRVLNVDLAKSDKNIEFMGKLKNSINLFESESKFNLQITKLCMSRGRIPRTGRMRNDCHYKLRQGDEIILTSDKHYENCSTNEVCYLSNFKRFLPLIEPEDKIRIGLKIVLKVTKVALGSLVNCCVMENDFIKSYQEVKISSIVDENLELTQEEIEDFDIAKYVGFDFIIVPGVNFPERYHKLKKLTRGSDLKMIADIDPRIEKAEIDRIIEHFNGVFVQASANDEYILNKARELKKLTIANFPMENSFGHQAMKVCENADLLMLECSSNVREAANNLINIMKNMKKLKEIRGSFNTKNVCIDSVLNVSSVVKAIVCLTQNEITAKRIASSHPQCTVIFLTKCKTLVKRLQMWRNVHAIVYDDNGEKSWNEQRKKMMKIAVMYGENMNIFKSEDAIVTCCPIESEFHDIDSFKISRISEFYE